MSNYKKIILNNGIPLYLYSNKSFKQVFVNYLVRYGSSGKWFNFELDGKKHTVGSGYAHYLEHLLVEHSKHGNIYTGFDKKNYDSNAYTSLGHTSYHFCGNKDIKESIKELIEAIDCPVFDKKDVDKTRHAIEEEASTKLDRYDITAVNLVEQNLYSGFDTYDYTLSSIGNRRTTRSITTDNLYTCYDAFYADENKALVVVGNIDEEELVDYLNDIYSNIAKHKSRVVLPKIDFDPLRKSHDEIRKNIGVDINSMGIKIRQPEGVSKIELYHSVDFIHDYLLSDENEFYNNLKRKKLIDNLYYNYLSWTDNYINFIHSFISNNPETYYSELLEKINKRDIKPEDFELIRKSVIAQEVRILDERYEIPYDFGNRVIYTEDYSDIEFLKKFTYERFMEIISKLEFDRYTTARVRSLKK